MITVERQLPRNTRIITLVSNAAMTPSRATLLIDSRTKVEASPSNEIFSDGGSDSPICGSIARMRLTSVRVEASPFFKAAISTE